MYRTGNPPKQGLRCVVYPDWPEPPAHSGSRFFFGVITTVTSREVVVQVKKSMWTPWKNESQHAFPKYQIWAEDDTRESVQLSLFK